MARQNQSRECIDTLSAFSLIPSRNYSIHQRCKEALERLDRGLTIRPWDVCVVLSDNVQYTQKGKQASCDHYTIVVPVVEEEVRDEERYTTKYDLLPEPFEQDM